MPSDKRTARLLTLSPIKLLLFALSGLREMDSHRFNTIYNTWTVITQPHNPLTTCDHDSQEDWIDPARLCRPTRKTGLILPVEVEVSRVIYDISGPS